MAITLAPGMHEARAALAVALLQSNAPAEATALLTPMLQEAAPLLSLASPASALAALEGALAAERRFDEATVVCEVRALAGGLDDGAHAALRARRLHGEASVAGAAVLDPETLRSAVVPGSATGTLGLLFDVATALAGAEEKLVRVDLRELGAEPRHRLPSSSPHPLAHLVHRLATKLGVARPEVVLSTEISRPRLVAKETPWLVVPEALLEQPEPVQAAALVGPLVRIALAVPWLEDFPAAYAHALLCGAARQVVPDFATQSRDGDQQDLIEDLTARVGRAIGRKQKKALAQLGPALATTPAPTLDDAAAFEQMVARAELRAAFVLTGDLLATLDVVRALDVELARATGTVGGPALGATLAHPLAGDLVRFALAPSTTALRWRAGTLWSGDPAPRART